MLFLAAPLRLGNSRGLADQTQPAARWLVTAATRWRRAQIKYGGRTCQAQDVYLWRSASQETTNWPVMMTRGSGKTQELGEGLIKVKQRRLLQTNGFIFTPQWGTADAEIKGPSAENPELQGSPF